jgi:2,3-bisphosphoglycerate-dependent phosphoglycerate mutase
MFTVFLVRHGESQSNAGMATPDPESVALTSRGYEQAQQVAHFFKINKQAFNLIVTSPFRRTRQTAESTMRLFPTVAVEEWSVQEFTYLSSYHQEKCTAKDRRPLVEVYWELCEPTLMDGYYPYVMVNPYSESFKVFIGRVQAFIRRLKDIDSRYQSIAVFSHEQFIAAVLWCLQYNPTVITSDSMRDFRTFFEGNRIPNGGIVEITARRRHDEWRYELLTEHLKWEVPEAPSPPVENLIPAGIR